MSAMTRPRLPGTLEGLLDTAVTLIRELEDTDDLLRQALAVLSGIERALTSGGAVGDMLFDINAARQMAEVGHDRVGRTLRRFQHEPE